MSSENEIYSVNSLSTLGALPPEVLNYDSAQFERLTPGYLLGEFKNYRLLERLGEGGMGQTWLAEELSGGEVVQKVVVKILSKELCGHEEALAEVRRVFDLTAKLRHPNICATLGMKKDPAFGWILVMDYADGGTLSDWFQSQPNHENGLPLEKILPILRPIAEALDFAHRKGILHRDVKPQNIMFTGKTPLLIDFGIAARIRPESVTQSTQTLGRSSTGHASSNSGTPVYMAPEQMMGKPQTGRTDQYALGMVLYELLAGKHPFVGENFAEIAFQKASFVPENPNFPASVNSALRKAFSSNPQDRFRTCAEFLIALSGPVHSPASPNAPVQEKTLEEMEREIYEKLRDEQRLKDEAARLAREQKEREEAAKRLREEAERRARERFEKEQAEKGSLEQKKAESPTIFTRRDFILGGVGVGVAAAGTLGLKWRREEAARRAAEEAAEEERLQREQAFASIPKNPSAGTRWTVKLYDIDYAFRWCPAGTFMMGSPKSEWNKAGIDWSYNEHQHEVTLTRGFWILETEVTQAMWENVMGENPSYFKGDQNPVEKVSWDECQDFCGKLSSKLGVKVSLPTEAQWEYACRAGTTGAYAGNLDAMAWYYSNSGRITYPVGQKQPNAWGLYDMHGNVWEWCSDWYGEDFYVKSPTNDPIGPHRGSRRVSRGGGWQRYAGFCRSAHRGTDSPNDRSWALGFRIVWQDSGK